MSHCTESPIAGSVVSFSPGASSIVVSFSGAVRTRKIWSRLYSNTTMRASLGIATGSVPELYGFTGLIGSPTIAPMSSDGAGNEGFLAASEDWENASAQTSAASGMRERVAGIVIRSFAA